MSAGRGTIMRPARTVGLACRPSPEAPSCGTTLMLLSFERPAAPAIPVRMGSLVVARAPSRTLRTAQLAKQRMGITEPFERKLGGQITVKIIRAHGGCLGTRSR